MTSSNSLHNENCFKYLKHLNISLEILATFPVELQGKLAQCKADREIDSKTPYADIYTAFFAYAEENISSIKEQRGFSDFIDSIYNNDNNILETTFKAIKDITQSQSPSSPRLEGALQDAVKDGSHETGTSQTPAQAGSNFGRLSAMIARNFKPQHTTSIATKRTYAYNEAPNVFPNEYRIPTQGQRHNGQVRVSPLFTAWIRSKKPTNLDTPPKIDHVYINNMGDDRTDFEGKREKAFTEALHDLNKLDKNGRNPNPNLAVITLPADKGLMDHRHYKKTTDELKYSDVHTQFMAIASEEPKVDIKIKDFKISPEIRKRVFINEDGTHSKKIEKEILEKLLTKSFNAMGIKLNTPLSTAQRQAVWFHFIKFELPNQIITKLNPDSINFSCKDAIDRGGVSSAYYNLMKSFETKTPLTRDKFDQALHAAPVMVKGRGMNDHFNMIWNAVDAYVTTNLDELKKNDKKAWLIEWRDMNCPHARVEKLLKLRVEQGITKLKKELITEDLQNPLKNKETIKNGIKILETIQSQSDIGVTGQRLLLEAAVLTPKIALDLNDTQNTERYKEIIGKLEVKYPMLQILTGLMKYFIGAIQCSKESMNAASEDIDAGINASKRNTLSRALLSAAPNTNAFAASLSSSENHSQSTELVPRLVNTLP